MKLEHVRYSIHPAVPFTIARGTMTSYDRVRIRLRGSAHEGWGEAAPSAYYHESADTVISALPLLGGVAAKRREIESLEDIDLFEQELRMVAPHAASARAAVSAAAYDLLGHKRGQPVWRLLGLDPMRAPPTSFTIAITDSEPDLIHRVQAAQRYPILKVKLGTDRDEWIVRTVRRAAPTKLLRADANAAWDLPRARTMAALLADEKFELLEQPLAAGDIEGFRALTKTSPIPIVADESCRTSADIPPLEGAVHGINIKLSKCGGLSEARRMVTDAHARGMRVMLGCMIESTLGIAAAAQLAPLVDWADLDGAALLRDDPFTGVSVEDGFIRLSDSPGLGVTPR
jgi:L-alanine-DL-glutamate epimerase-like enolase superfamily enzyme